MILERLLEMHFHRGEMVILNLVLRVATVFFVNALMARF
jgi:hypothetical protein